MIEVHFYEVDQLIIWHLEEQWTAANKGRYDDAKEHQQRVAELREAVERHKKARAAV